MTRNVEAVSQLALVPAFIPAIVVHEDEALEFVLHPSPFYRVMCVLDHFAALDDESDEPHFTHIRCLNCNTPITISDHLSLCRPNCSLNEAVVVDLRWNSDGKITYLERVAP